MRGLHDGSTDARNTGIVWPMARRRIAVSNIPDPIRQALLERVEDTKTSANDLVTGWLVDRYRIDGLRFGGKPPGGTNCDPLILKVPEEVWREVRMHAARVGTSLRAIVIDTLARELDLTEHAVPMSRPRARV